MLHKLFPFWKEQEERWVQLDDSLGKAFGKVREDTNNLFSWITFFHQHLQDHRRQTHTLHQGFQRAQARIETLEGELMDLRKKVMLLEHTPVPAQIVVKSEPSTNLVRTKSEPSTNQKRTNFERKILSRAQTKRKPYVMEKILALLGEQPIATKELERVIVDEQGLCGRTTFYSYLRELRIQQKVRMDERGFEKVLVRS